MQSTPTVFKVGQSWSYRAPKGFENSRMIIGALATFNETERVICASVIAAPRDTDDGRIEAVTIPFLPMSESAFAKSVIWNDGQCEPPEGFAQALTEWNNDPRGLSLFTVPFEGYLDRLIALQMAEIVRDSAA